MSKTPNNVLPQEDVVRKQAPMYRGLLGYFPWALFKVAAHSYRSDRKHNPDSPESEAPHWRRSASTDHADCILRHLSEMHTDPDYHTVAIAWRALALLQEHGEKVHGAAPGARSVFANPDRMADSNERPATPLDRAAAEFNARIDPTQTA